MRPAALTKAEVLRAMSLGIAAHLVVVLRQQALLLGQLLRLEGQLASQRCHLLC